jgi:hypothetical protein
MLGFIRAREGQPGDVHVSELIGKMYKGRATTPMMTFTIEEDEDIDYSATPLQAEVVVNTESTHLLSDRVVGTVGFCGALALLSSTCCCFCKGCHKTELTHTYNKFTLFGLCCPFR